MSVIIDLRLHEEAILTGFNEMIAKPIMIISSSVSVDEIILAANDF
jgi:hypothetical protein